VPFVRIDLAQGKPADYRKMVGEIVYQAMRDTFDVPEDDKFQVITEHAPGDLNLAESYLGNHYSGDVMLIQITMSFGRSVEKKQAFYKRIVDDLNAKLNVRRDDVVINLVEVAKENWSFGGGIAQYVM
jgi:phenylpyruvate tautomerase PptA (4-oxalocrotonate tautomerase family)